MTRKIMTLVASAGLCGMLLVPGVSRAQPADPPPAPPPPREQPAGAGKDAANSPMVRRLMALDKNGDGKLTKDEVTDTRLQRLFERADADHDGTVTREELTALAAKMEAEGPQGGGGRGGAGGGGGFGGPSGGPGGPGGPGGRGPGGPPRPGVVLPPSAQDMLNLTPEQREKVQALQADVDRKLGEILTPEQKQQLQEMRNRGPGRGPGGPGGPGGRRGPGGPGGPDGPGGPPGPDGPRGGDEPPPKV